MNPWVYITVGAVMVAAGSLLGAYGWFKLPRDNTKLENLIRESTQELQRSLDEKIISANSNVTGPTNIRDPRMRDGGKVSVAVHWKDGPIIDIGSKANIKANRILLSAKYPDELFLHLYDSDGKYYELHSGFNKLDTQVQLDCIWSSKDRFIAMMADGKVLARVQLPSLTLFHDIDQQRELLVGHSFDGTHGFGNIRDITVFALKELTSDGPIARSASRAPKPVRPKNKAAQQRSPAGPPEQSTQIMVDSPGGIQAGRDVSQK